MVQCTCRSTNFPAPTSWRRSVWRWRCWRFLRRDLPALKWTQICCVISRYVCLWWEKLTLLELFVDPLVVEVVASVRSFLAGGELCSQQPSATLDIYTHWKCNKTNQNSVNFNLSSRAPSYQHAIQQQHLALTDPSNKETKKNVHKSSWQKTHTFQDGGAGLIVSTRVSMNNKFPPFFVQI